MSSAAMVIESERTDRVHEQALSLWLGEHGLSNLLPCLLDNQLDLGLLGELDESMLERMGLSLGMRLRLLRAIRSRPVPGPAVPAVAERRQLSVMFCDIVDSTALATRLDAEDLRSVLDGWRQRVIQTMQPAGAYLSQFLGDGALLYFGYPTACEDDAEKAVRAALTLLSPRARGMTPAGRGSDTADGSSVESLVDTLRLRIGIATGPVVLDRLATSCGAGELSAVGRIPHLAARLQTIAPPDGLCVDERTARLCGHAFDMSARDLDGVRGFAEPVTVYSVRGTRCSASRFEARHARGYPALIGRTRELSRIESALSRVSTGRADVLSLQGEPGIGKSRLCYEMVSRIRSNAGQALVLQCSPFHVDLPLYAVTQCVRQRIDALRALPANASGELDVLQALAARLEQDVVDVAGADAHGKTAYQRREALLACCSAWFERLATQAPLTVLLEDLHWCDATTLELLERMMQRCAALPVLLLVTGRPGSDEQVARRLGASRIVLQRLDRAQIERLLQRQLGTHRLPAGLCDAIDSRTDGVPLFIVELTRSLCESGHLRRRDELWRFDPDLSAVPIPDSLQASLAARLDLLDQSLRIVVRMAACLGRSFAFDDLSEMLDSEPPVLRNALDRLAAMRLVQIQDGTAGRRYEFRHALVRDVAWEGMLHAERRRLHARVQRGLVARRARGVAVAPGVLARHLEGAGERDGAIREWRSAARVSAHRSANPECMAHLQRALALIEADPARSARLHEELGVLLELLPPCRVITGRASREVAEFTQRALTLADDRSCDRTAMLQLVYFEWVHEHATGERGRSLALAEAMLARATHHPVDEGDDAFLMTALRAVGVSRFGAGRLHEGIADFDKSLALYRAGRQGPSIEAIGMDGQVLALGYRALALWCIGERHTAHRTAQAMQSHAETLAHAPSLAFSLFHRALLNGVLEGQASALASDGDALRTLGCSYRFGSWEICGELLHDMGAVLDGPTGAGLSRVERTLKDSADMGIVYHPLLHDVLARACLAHGERQRATVHLHEAFALRARTGERWSDPRLWLTAAQIAVPDGVSRVRTCLNASVRQALRSGARTWLDIARGRLERLPDPTERGAVGSAIVEHPSSP